MEHHATHLLIILQTLSSALLMCSNHPFSQQEDELCSVVGVEGYPTIKYFLAGESNDYSGGRSYEALDSFVKETMFPKCDVGNLEGEECSEKAIVYVNKWRQKDIFDIQKESMRLAGMRGKSMKADLKIWLNERINILDQLVNVHGEL